MISELPRGLGHNLAYLDARRRSLRQIKSGPEEIVSSRPGAVTKVGPTAAWLKTKCGTVETLDIVGVKIADNGAPYAIMANAAGEDIGEALVTLPRAERDAFWQVVEMLETPRARLAPFLKRSTRHVGSRPAYRRRFAICAERRSCGMRR